MKTKLLVLALGLSFLACAAAWAQTPDELPPAGMVRNDDPERPPDPQVEPGDQPQDGFDQEPNQEPIQDPSSGDPAAPFRVALDDYGTWTQRAGYDVWVPRDMPAGWRPYTTGQWADTDEGWTWVADEEWGWAPFHYGRWYFDAELGWAWIPGSVWAPAWVSWRSGDGYVGWAPLPPAVGFDIAAGVDVAAVERIHSDHYTFVAERSFLTPHVRNVLVSPAHSPELCRRSQNFTRYSVQGGHVRNGGLPVEHVERATGRHVPHLQISTSNSRWVGHGAAPGKLVVYQPTSLSRRAARPEFGSPRSQPRSAGNHGAPNPGHDRYGTTPGGRSRYSSSTQRPEPYSRSGSSSSNRDSQGSGNHRYSGNSAGTNRNGGGVPSNGNSESWRYRSGQNPSTERTQPRDRSSSSRYIPHTDRAQPPPRQQRPSPPPSRQVAPPSTRQQHSPPPRQNDRSSSGQSHDRSSSSKSSGSSSHHDRRPPS